MEEKERNDASLLGNGVYILLTDYDYRSTSDNVRTSDCVDVSQSTANKNKIVSIVYDGLI